MPYKDVEIGARGHLRCQVDLVSQDKTNNKSTVRVRGFIWLDAGSSSSDNTGNCKAKITGDHDYGPITANFSVSGTTKKEIIDRTFTITHSSDGYAKADYRVHFGPTITTNFGDGGSVAVNYSLPRISQEPGAPTNLKLTLVGGNKVLASWTAPNNGGSAITKNEIQYSLSPSWFLPDMPRSDSGFEFGPVTSIMTGPFVQGRTIYFHVRAYNDKGWSPWSSQEAIDTPSVPDDPPVPVLTVALPNRVTAVGDIPEDGNSPITGYVFQYSQTSDFTTGVFEKETTDTTTEILPPRGGYWYIRYAAVNVVGRGAWSPSAEALIPIGPETLRNGQWRDTQAYVRHEGVWKPAIPYVKVAGVWRPIDV